MITLLQRQSMTESESVAKREQALRAVAFWQRRTTRKLTEEDGREIVENLTGFRPIRKPTATPGKICPRCLTVAEILPISALARTISGRRPVLEFLLAGRDTRKAMVEK